jgi:hypothetical protein
MTAPTTQSEPTAEQLPKWDGEVMGGTARMYRLGDRQTGVTVYTTASTLRLSKEAYAAGNEAGREALLAELRAGGVELPDFAVTIYSPNAILNYGDRRAAATVRSAVSVIARMLKVHEDRGDEDATQIAEAMLAAAPKDHTP